MRVNKDGSGGRIAKTDKWYLAAFITLMVLLFHADANAFIFTVNVKDDNNAAVNGFRWLLEEDNTYPIVPGAHVSDSPAVSIHKSHAPVAANGASATSSATITVPDGRYFLSVLASTMNYTLSGASIDTIKLAANPVVDVVLHNHPVPTAQLSVLVFHDNQPINNAPDQPFEAGLEGFTVIVNDQLGQMSQDAFGNPLGTTYQFDALGNPMTDLAGNYLIDMMGTGEIKTDANGTASVKYLAPGKYTILITPPIGTDWIQTNTIEGTPKIDAWVKANEPPLLIEFGPGLPHVFFGFVHPMDLLGTMPLQPGESRGTVTGRIVKTHQARPPDILLYNGVPVPECYIGLNTAAGTGVYVKACNDDSTFQINNVPPGTYQIVIWDKPLDTIFGFYTVIVPPAGGTINTGDIPVNQWFGTLKGTVFSDNTNTDGYMDPGESGIPNQIVNLRFRDGSMYQTTTTRPDGGYMFEEVFPFFKWLMVEVDYTRYKPTGSTLIVDDGGPLAPGAELNPQLQPENSNLGWRTETSPFPVLLEAMTLYADQTNIINWGKVNYGQNENGGIAGIIYYATTRTEADPRAAVPDPWEPGIPRVQVNLYQDADMNGVIDDLNGDSSVTLADVDNYPLSWSTGGAKGPEDVDYNSDGIFDPGDALNIAWSDSWDDNMPTGCVGPAQSAYGQPLQDCAETMVTWNQLRPGVFDGGYIFTSYFPGGMASGAAEAEGLPAGTYIVQVNLPNGYELVKEEDQNIFTGDQYSPSLLLLPSVCVGDPHPVPPYQTLFPDQLLPAPFANQTRPLCDKKQVKLSDGQNAAADFHLFTEVPKAARVVGLITNDLAVTQNPNNPVFTEKATVPWIPISFRDYTGKELVRTYSDEWGAYNALLPSTYTINPPIPTGVSPHMISICLNNPGPIPDPAHPDQFITDPNFDPRFSSTCYTLDFWPGKTTYADTPVIAVAAFAAPQSATLDCQFPDATPVIYSVSGGADVGPYVSGSGQSITITSAGTNVEVPNPDYDPFVVPGNPKTVFRDYSFGAAQGSGSVTVGGIPLTINSWSPTTIDAAVPPGTQTGELLVTRGNGKSTVMGVTLNVGNNGNPVVNLLSTDSIQTAITNAAPGTLIMVPPGTYNENIILYKNVKLQGWGAASTFINASPIPIERVPAWRSLLNSFIAGNQVDLAPGQTPAFTEEIAPGIMVITKQNTFSSGLRPRIDGFTIMGASTSEGIFVNAYAHYLEISNNRIISNQGPYAGAIRIGTPGLTDPGCIDSHSNAVYCSSQNDHLNIHHNHIAGNGTSGFVANGGGAGGISLYNGSDFYTVRDNFVCGNFTTAKGAGIVHSGMSNQGEISFNKVLFNEASFGTGSGGDGGGIMIAGEPALAGAPGNLTVGTGTVLINANLIQGNLSGAGLGGGIFTSQVNGRDVFYSPFNSANWNTVNIFNNMIVNNMAGYAGGGIAMFDTAKVRIINNTIADNDSSATGIAAFTNGLQQSMPQGAGIVSTLHSAELKNVIGSGGGPEFNTNFSNPLLYNNILWQNRSFYWDANQAANATGGLVANPSLPYWDLQVLGSTTFKMSPQYCILTSATGYSSTNRGGTANNPRFDTPYFNQLSAAASPGEGGNFIQALFKPLTLTGNYHIQSNSPAINRGSNIYLSLVPADYDRQSRPNGVLVDIGADEFSTFVANPTITVVAPNGGENWPIGATRTINWTYTGNPGNVKIELFKGGLLNRTISANAFIGSGGNGSYSWTIPVNQTTGADFQVKVTSASNATVTDTSNANFTISPPTITVVAPNGGENWTRGTIRTITWTYTGNPGTFLKIELLKGGVLNSTITTFASAGINGNGSFTWFIPFNQATGNNYRIRVTSTANGTVTDMSNADFAIQ